VSLVFARDLRAGLVYTTAQSINWLLGAGSYFLLPSLGPIYADAGAFSALPASEVTRLQGVLLDQRVAFLQDPAGSTPQAIAAFVSLHISMSFTAAMAAHLLGAGRRLRIALWTWLALTTVGTVYLGWHYFVDDIAGVALGAVALALAAVLSGVDLRPGRATARVARAEDRGARAPVPATEPGTR
jgi:membrane-associated phospholipid phosphatase